MPKSIEFSLILRHILSTLPGCLLIIGILLFFIGFILTLADFKKINANSKEHQTMITDHIFGISLAFIATSLLHISFFTAGCLPGLLIVIPLYGMAYNYFQPYHSLCKFFKFFTKFENDNQLTDSTVFAIFVDDDTSIRVIISIICPILMVFGFFIIPGRLGDWIFGINFTLLLLSMPIGYNVGGGII